jgi:hypothetical protein
MQWENASSPVCDVAVVEVEVVVETLATPAEGAPPPQPAANSEKAATAATDATTSGRDGIMD